MTEESEDSSPTALLDLYCSTMKENKEFLHRNAEKTYREVINLINDAINYMTMAFETKKKENKVDYVKNPMCFFLHHVLMPQSYAILADLLIGNLPACFMELRLMLETMAKCHFASLHPNRTLFFEPKLELLEKQKRSTSKLLEDFGNVIGLGDKPVALWGKLSNYWVHPRGIVKRVVNEIVEKSDVPSWAWIIPMNYSESDLDTIKELDKCISQFRSILKATMKNYEQITIN